jgi:hypothetical protein
MAGVLSQSNSFKLTGKIGRRPTDNELYMAHFMGVGGAAKLISNAEDNPKASAARLFPNAAAANRSIFYEKGTGRARSVSEVYSVLTTRYAAAANAKDTRTAFAALGDMPSRVAAANAATPVAAPVAAMDTGAYLSIIPDSRKVTPVTASAPTQLKTASLPQQEPMFRSLFQAGDRAQPISPAVQELWANPSRATVASAANHAPEVRAPGRLDLFSDRNGTFSS